jgi:hypothetical protein
MVCCVGLCGRESRSRHESHDSKISRAFSTHQSSLQPSFQDLAFCVESQDEGIHQLEAMAIESLDSNSSGLSYLLKMQHEAARASKRRKQLLAGASAAILIVSAMHWILSATNGVHNEDGPNEH